MGKSGWQSVKRDDQSGSVRRTGIARQALLPGEPPMCTLRSGPDLLCGCFCAWRRERSGTLQANRLAADNFEPVPPDATTRPVAPEHRSRGRRCTGCLRRRPGIRTRSVQRPQDRTHPPWFERGAALLTLGPQRAGAAMTNTCSIQDPQGPIALRTPLLEIERVISRAPQGSIRLGSKGRTREAVRKR